MPEPDFNDLAQRLLRSGVTPRETHRTVRELRDHYEDLVAEYSDSAGSQRTAAAEAAQQLGPFDAIVEEMERRRELKTWSFRYPRTALVIYPLACLLTLPALPVLAGIAHRVSVARWGAALLGAGLVTAAMMLILQLSILFA